MARQRERWGTRVGAILAVTGSAVGLGNFLRFPGQAAQYGGGAFMIPYLIAFLIVGLPLAWAEWALGRYGGSMGHNSVPGIFRSLTKRRSGAYIGLLGTLMPVMIYMYYVFVEAWCLAYAWDFLAGNFAVLGSDAEKIGEHFANSVGVG
jgi:NSS family neurotransmitter:Na+ symporter